MKTLSIFLPFFIFFGLNKAYAQTDKNEEVQEIIIKKKGDKDASLRIEFDKGNVTINGKPLVEFNDGNDIQINKRKIVIGRNYGQGLEEEFMRQFNGENLLKQFHFKFGDEDSEMNGMGGNMPILGVSTDKNEEGVKITDVSKGSAAEKAGLLKDDIITSIDGVSITDPVKLSETIRSKKVKDEIKINYLRGKKKRDTKAILQEGKNMNGYNFSMPDVEKDIDVRVVPGFPTPPTPPQAPRIFTWPSQKEEAHKLGIRVSDLPTGKGVKIIEVEAGSAAEISGLKTNDIVTELNGKVIDNTDNARQALFTNRMAETYPVKILRNGVAQTITVTFPKQIKTVDL